MASAASGDRFDTFWAALDAVPVESDAEALYDVTSAEGRLRRANLQRYLDTVGAGADTLLVAEAPGWRGMTNTGVPFTSMRELTALDGAGTHGAGARGAGAHGAGALDGSGAAGGYLVPPEPTAPWEASSRVVHAALAQWRGPLPVAWAIFPHHPFAAPDRLTNRTPRPAEVRAGAPVALALLEALRRSRAGADGAGADGAGADGADADGARADGAGADGADADGADADGARADGAGADGAGADIRVVAVGRKAQGALALAGIEAVAVRHPAQGGAAQFTEQLLALDR